MRIARLALPALLCLPALAAVPAQAANTLVPHRAVYDLALESASDRSGITGLSGRMVYEFNGSACDGYTVTFRFVTQISTSEASRMTDQQTTTFEDGGGDSFNFVTRSFVEGTLDKELRGVASLEGDATNVTLERPEPREVALEPTQFPTHHLLELMDKARAGETFYETTLYDGSEDGDKVVTTTVIIGREAPAAPQDAERGALEDLADEPFWPVDMAYFDMSDTQGEELPIYRIGFKLHENGVTRDLSMDYGEFAMTGRLVDLTLFDKPDCGE